MSELSSENKSRALISINSSEKAEQLGIISEGNLSPGEDHFDSIESVFSNNFTIDTKNDNVIANELDVSIKNPHKYPLTERSKRRMAIKIRMERERKSEQINKINEQITHSAKVIKNKLRENHVKKTESLRKINNNQWHYDRNFIHDLQSPSLNEKIDTLDSKLKQLENELIIEKKRFENMEGHFNNPNIIVPDENTTISNDDNHLNEETIINDPLNSVKPINRKKFMDVCFVNNHVYDHNLNLESRLTFRPKCIEFKLRLDKNGKCISKQLLKVTNCSKNIILCRYSHLLDSNSIFKNNTNIIKVKTVSLCRLQPAITIDYVITFNPMELQNSLTNLNLEGVMLVFETIETESNKRPNVKYSYHIPIKFYMSKPEPELVTRTINFPATLGSRNNNINDKKYLILQNNGDADCVFSVINETDNQRTHNTDNSTVALNLSKEMKNVSNFVEDVCDRILYKNFNYFTWRNHVNVSLPAKGSVKVPVVFNRNIANSTVSQCYNIEFDNTEYTIPNQKVNVIGDVKDENIIVKPNVIDAGLCYLTSSIQAVSFNLQNKNRVAVPFVIKVPSKLSKHVELNPSKGHLKAESSLDIFVQLRLKYDILQLNDCEMYFDAKTGVLEFPVHVYPWNCKISYDVRIRAVVTTSFGLRLTPDRLDFGTVNTTETVVRDVMLANHSRSMMEYGFLKLPERVSVYPSAFGSIFSSEEICLHVHYSPSARLLPPKVYLFEDEFILSCNTITGLNADKFNSKVEMNKLFRGEISREIQITNSTINIKELDHGPNKITIPESKNVVEIETLNENTILKEATIKCRARILDIPVELSVQKIIFEKTYFSSYSCFKFELRASNLASIFERKIKSFPDFKIKFEFVSNDPSVEFKPKNGILQSKEIIQIYIIFRPKFDDELQKMYYECLDSKITKMEMENILNDKNSFVNQVYINKPFLLEHTNVFEAKKIFYSLMADKTNIIPAACFIRFVDHGKSVEYFGFDTGSLKLSIVCPTTKPNIILFVDRINFGKCTIGVRHDEWLLAQNITMRPVPLRISATDPIGPFFCAFALKGERLLSPGEIVKINVSFIPEHEMTVYEILEMESETMRLDVKLRGSGIRPSCKITPDDVFITILNAHNDQPNNNHYGFRVTNTGDIGVPFNVQMEWSKERFEQMADDEAFGFVRRLRENNRVDSATTLFDGSDWTELKDEHGDVFDLGNGGQPLRFRLDPDAEHYVQVTFRSPPLPVPELRNDERDVADDPGSHRNNDHDRNIVTSRHHVYVAKFNVHVGRLVLHRFYVFCVVDETSAA